MTAPTRKMIPPIPRRFRLSILNLQFVRETDRVVRIALHLKRARLILYTVYSIPTKLIVAMDRYKFFFKNFPFFREKTKLRLRIHNSSVSGGAMRKYASSIVIASLLILLGALPHTGAQTKPG